MKKKLILITTLILLIITILNIVLNLPKAMALTQTDVEEMFYNSWEVSIGNSNKCIDNNWIGDLTSKNLKISYDIFKESNNMFCMNEGNHYSSYNAYENGYLFVVKSGALYIYKDNEYVEANSNVLQENFRVNADITNPKIYNQVAYILNESQKQENRIDVENYIYQQAIWDLLQGKNSTNGRNAKVKNILQKSETYVNGNTKNIDAVFYILQQTDTYERMIQTINANVIEECWAFDKAGYAYEYRNNIYKPYHCGIIQYKTEEKCIICGGNKRLADGKCLNCKASLNNIKYYSEIREKEGKLEYKMEVYFFEDVHIDKLSNYSESASFVQNKNVQDIVLYRDIFYTIGESDDNKEFTILVGNFTNEYYQNILIGKATEYEEEETISLSGTVWLDGQQGLKPVSLPNGYFDTNENCLEGISVFLYDNDTKKTIKTTSTDKNGNYKFTDIPKNKNGYKIQFAYDGINYIVTETNAGNDTTIYSGRKSDEIDSDVIDINREEFNNKFYKIEKGIATSKDGKDKTNLAYKYTDDKATLNLENESYHIIYAETTKSYNETTKFINMGLVKKGVDLSAYTSIDSAKVSINGKTITYKGTSINNIINGNEAATYNIYLYNSDYNYRIGDYKGLKESTTAEETETFKNNSSELEVYITYKVILNNESVTPAKIYKIAYYCDIDLDINTINDSNRTYIYKGNKTINGKTYNKYEITFLKPIELNNENNQYVFNLEFNVAKDDLGHIIIDENKNYVEILSYSTDTGCIDCDSEPGNIEEHPNEDDSDDAPVINICLTEEGREISGFVFEDLKTTDNQFGNGYYESETENKVDDVIVQLIEKKSIEINGTTQNLEYIWQETVSGSNIVKCVSLDGQFITSYIVENSEGQYQFKEFIPGNYIIRFIYGDGTYYDTAIDGTTSTDKSKANILKYNGQAYKSAIDLGYKETNYDNEFYGQMGCERYENDESGTNNIFYKANLSKARDNEARRLEEMAYATANATSLVIDSKDKIENTWMCAETSNIVVSVGIGTKFEQNNVNLGLILRPHSSYTLEKHIVKLKVDNIADVEVAKDENGNYIFENGILGYTDSIGGLVLATTTTKDTAIGRWTIETDLDNVRGGISITYCYKITNNGESEYIGAKLSEALNNGQQYSDLAGEVKKYQKTSTSNSYSGIGMYLGTTYYIGNSETDIAIGGAGSVKVEDYLTSNTKRALSIKNSEFTSVGTATKSVWIDNSTTGQEIVNVIQSNEISLAKGESKYIYLELSKDNIDTTTIKDGLTYKSYAAQLVSSDNMASTTLGNLQYVQAYTDDVPVRDIVPEDDEFIAETVIITKSTGLTDLSVIENTNNNTMKIVIAVTSGVAIIAIGAVLIKKFII